MRPLFQLILIGALVIIGSSCERDSNFEGPDLNDIYGEFTTLQEVAATAATVDFSMGETAQFTALFSAQTEWVLTITSLANGAKKTITGRSKELNADNATWNGSTSEFPSFSNGPCSVQLLALADSSVSTTTITVTGVRQQQGVLITDFETGISPDWELFFQSGANMSFVPAQNELVPQGEFYFDMGGEVTWDWLIGLIDFPATAYGTNGFDLTGNPNDLYFNVLLNKPEGITNSIVLFQFKEDDNGDGNFSESSEDTYAIELNALADGWQVISIKYSDLTSLVNGQPATPNGNAAHNPELLHEVSCLFLANPNSGYSQVLMDYLIFTTGEPLIL